MSKPGLCCSDAKVAVDTLSRALEMEGPFAAVIGPGCSVACEPTSFYLTSARNIAQISPSCTSAALSDKSQHPVSELQSLCVNCSDYGVL